MSRKRKNSRRNDARPAQDTQRQQPRAASQTPRSASSATRRARATQSATVTAKATLNRAASAQATQPTRQARPAQAIQVADLAPATLFPEAPAAAVETLPIADAETPTLAQTPPMPDQPEMPETPDEPEIPEMLETSDIPDVPEPPEPEQPEEPIVPPTPTETDTADGAMALLESLPPLAPLADEVQVADAVGAPVVPVTTERRMPTLAVMAHPRNEAAPASDQQNVIPEPDTTTAAASTPEIFPTKIPPTRKRPRRPAAPVRTAEPAITEDANAYAEQAEPIQPTTAAAPQGSFVTRPVDAHTNEKRARIMQTPDFIWENDPRLPHLPWPIRHHLSSRPQALPPAGMVPPVVLVHILFCAMLGLLGALQGVTLTSGSGISTLGTWLLFGSLIAGAGGAVAYFFNESERFRRFAPAVLALSQLGLLVWAMVMLGPRPTLLLLTPAVVELALLIGDGLLASVVALGAVAIYAIFAGLSVGLMWRPVLALNTATGTALDVVFIVVGSLLSLWLLLTIQSGRERAQAIARARRHEADVLRNLVTRFRQEMQDDTARLEAALIEALKGKGIDPIPSEGMYRLLAETIMDTASRLEVLQRDREERLRLEGALSAAIRAVEREWLGVDPKWPTQTGTSVDELVTLLRSPRIHATYQREADAPVTPRIIPIPSIAGERDNTPPPTPVSRPLSGETWVTARRQSRRPDLYPLPSANEAADSPSHPNDHSVNGNGAHWNTTHYWADRNDE